MLLTWTLRIQKLTPKLENLEVMVDERGWWWSIQGSFKKKKNENLLVYLVKISGSDTATQGEMKS